jgi:hypothetical protein
MTAQPHLGPATVLATSLNFFSAIFPLAILVAARCGFVVTVAVLVTVTVLTVVHVPRGVASGELASGYHEHGDAHRSGGNRPFIGFPGSPASHENSLSLLRSARLRDSRYASALARSSSTVQCSAASPRAACDLTEPGAQPIALAASFSLSPR